MAKLTVSSVRDTGRAWMPDAEAIENMTPPIRGRGLGEPVWGAFEGVSGPGWTRVGFS
jgi:hypothetical protein